MKKYFIALAFVFLIGSRAKSEFVGALQGPEQALATSDYAGVRVDVSSGSSTARRAFKGPGVVYGVMFSTGLTSDYVAFRDTDTANGTSQEFGRLYNIGNLNGSIGYTNSFTTGAANASMFLKPIRVKNGLSWNGNVATYNFIQLYYEILDSPGQ